jgi:hypothetical protein
MVILLMRPCDRSLINPPSRTPSGHVLRDHAIGSPEFLIPRGNVERILHCTQVGACSLDALAAHLRQDDAMQGIVLSHVTIDVARPSVQIA